MEQAHVATEVVESLYEAVSHSLEVGHVVAPELSGLAAGVGFRPSNFLSKKLLNIVYLWLSHEGVLHQVHVFNLPCRISFSKR